MHDALPSPLTEYVSDLATDMVEAGLCPADEAACMGWLKEHGYWSEWMQRDGFDRVLDAMRALQVHSEANAVALGLIREAGQIAAFVLGTGSALALLGTLRLVMMGA